MKLVSDKECPGARTFPGAWHHMSTFFNTLELGVGYAAVASATALSQVRRRMEAKPCAHLRQMECFCFQQPHSKKD